MFGLKPKPRLVRVEVLLKHGDREIYPGVTEVIDLAPDETFISEIGEYQIRRGKNLVRTIRFRAGYTEDLRYFYQ